MNITSSHQFNVDVYFVVMFVKKLSRFLIFISFKGKSFVTDFFLLNIFMSCSIRFKDEIYYNCDSNCADNRIFLQWCNSLDKVKDRDIYLFFFFLVSNFSSIRK